MADDSFLRMVKKSQRKNQMSDYMNYRRRNMRTFELEKLFNLVQDMLLHTNPRKLDEIVEKIDIQVEKIKRLPPPDASYGN